MGAIQAALSIKNRIDRIKITGTGCMGFSGPGVKSGEAETISICSTEQRKRQGIALQVLTLLEFVARQELVKEKAQLASLVPGNPKMKLGRPTAERLLAKFDGLHVVVERNGSSVVGYLAETPLYRTKNNLLKNKIKIEAFFGDCKIPALMIL